MDSEDRYAKKAEQINFFDQVNEQQADQKEQFKEEIRKMEHIAIQLKQKVDRDIKNAKAELKSSVFDESSADNIVTSGHVGRSVSPALQTALDQKTDQNYLDQMLDKKASKNDTEVALKKLEVIQKQLKHLAVLITEKIKNSLENENGVETKNQKTNRKVKLLH